MSSESTGEHTGEGKGDNGRKAQTRARVWRACEACRKRKVKCNGQAPCSYCTSSNKVCTFKDTSDNAPSARQYDHSSHHRDNMPQESHDIVVSRQTNSVELRLAKIEETVQKLLPMAQAFEAWLKANDQTPASALPFRMGPESSTFLNSRSFYPSHSPSSDGHHSSTLYRPSNAINELCAKGMLEQGFTLQGHTEHLSDSAIFGPEKWLDKYSHLTQDPRYPSGASTLSPGADIQLPLHKTSRRQAALPLPEDITYPSPDLADELVATYFARIHHTFPILHQQTFVEQYVKVMEQKVEGEPSKDHGFLSALFAVFACGACLVEKGKPKSEPVEGSELGLEFYENARLLLWMGAGMSQIEHVQCLSIMAICNTAWNTLAQSWINVGAAVRRAQDLGLHLSGKRLSFASFEREYRRRVWFCVYGLDRILSLCLGRPNGTHEDDFDVDMSSELDDAQLTALRDGIPPPSTTNGKSFMTGFVALLKIYIIAGKIMRFVRSAFVENAEVEKTRKIIADLDSELDNWIHQLPPGIRSVANDTSNPQTHTFCLIAFFIYYSAVINLHRPFIPDHLASSDNSQCLSAARSCIRIGEIIQERLSASHYLAFAVQYITLSAILLLRSVAYVNQGDLVSAVISAVEQAIDTLERMETVWSASKRFREIVSDLLVLVRTKLYRGASVIEAPQAAQLRQQESQHESVAAGVKRKRPPEPELVASSSRQRLDDGGWPSTGTSPSDQRYYATREQDFGNEGYSSHIRTSNVRTSDSDSDSPLTPSDSVLRHALSSARGDSGTVIAQSTGKWALPPFEELMKVPILPQISLDIGALANHGTDEYFGYDFLGSDILALLGNVVKTSEQPSPQTFEENAQMLRQAFHTEPRDVPFRT